MLVKSYVSWGPGGGEGRVREPSKVNSNKSQTGTTIITEKLKHSLVKKFGVGMFTNARVY